MNPGTPTEVTAQHVSTLVNDVLGELAFMITDASESETLSCEVWVTGEVRYRGPQSGALHCWCSRPFGAQLAANLLGIEAGSPDAQLAAEDALRELLNVLCGQLVTRWFGSGAVFNLSIPKTRETNESPRAFGRPGDQSYAITIDGEPLLVVHRPDA